MLKKVLRGMSICICSVFILVGTYVITNRLNPPIVETPSSAIHFTDISSIEENSSIIVRVKALDEKEQLITSYINIKGQKVPLVGFTLTSVQIKKIYKGEDIIKGYAKDNVIKVA